MAYNNPGEVLTDIANSIRTLYGSTSSIPFVDMPELIKGAIGEPIDLSDYNGTDWELSFIEHVDFSGMNFMTGMFSYIDAGTYPTSARSLNFENLLVTVPCDSLFAHSKFVDLNLSGWEFSSTVSRMDRLFSVARIQNLNLSNWIIPSLSIEEMFYGATIGSLDLTGWDTSEVPNMKEMFKSATVTKIWVPSTFVATAVTAANKPFRYGTGEIYTDATDAETQGWGTVASTWVVHYNSTYQDFINA